MTVHNVARRSLSKLLVSPSKVANALEWNKAGGSVLSVHINRSELELLVASHPSSEEPVQTLPSIPLRTEIHVENPNQTPRRRLSPAVAREFEQIMHDWQVSGIVVNWPVQSEGWCGASCGRVLFTLDHLHAYKVLSKPLCLWDELHHDLPYEDEWGRCAQYSMVSSKTEHYASKEQYDAPETSLMNVWHDFCLFHWPEYYNFSGGYSSTMTAPNIRKPWLPKVPTLRSNLQDE